MEKKEKIGIVQNCNIDTGQIMTEKNDYIFFNTDLYDNVKNGDVVSFYGDENAKVKRAYFVKKLKYFGGNN